MIAEVQQTLDLQRGIDVARRLRQVATRESGKAWGSITKEL